MIEYHSLSFFYPKCLTGWKFNHWELKGVPLRMEVGPRDMKSNQVIYEPARSVPDLFSQFYDYFGSIRSHFFCSILSLNYHQVVVVRRDIGTKKTLSVEGFEADIQSLLNTIHDDM